MAKPLVSILMPVWNAESTLDEAVASIQAQTFPNWELIVVDDGSTDGSLACLRKWALGDPRIKVIADEHRGIVETLQTASRAAQGSFLARMDADDWADPARIEKQAAFMADRPDVALCGTHVYSDPATLGMGRARYQTWINELAEPETIRKEIFIECPIAHPTFFMRREAFEAVGGYLDMGWAEDYDLVLRLNAAGHELANVPEPLLLWRNHPDRHSMADTRYEPAAFRRAKRHYLALTHLPPERPFVQWGAGIVGKEWLKEWPRKPLAAVDINPRKIGKTIHGVPVIGPEALSPPGDAFIVVTVGSPGARDDIRGWLNPRGYREVEDYLFLA